MQVVVQSVSTMAETHPAKKSRFAVNIGGCWVFHEARPGIQVGRFSLWSAAKQTNAGAAMEIRKILPTGCGVSGEISANVSSPPRAFQRNCILFLRRGDRHLTGCGGDRAIADHEPHDINSRLVG